MGKIASLIIFFFMVSLNACTNIETYAPVSEIDTIEPIPKKGVHKVTAEETLYSIAWRYGLDYQAVAKLNNIASPYHIKSGQLIYLSKNKTIKKTVVSSKEVKFVQPQTVTLEPRKKVVKSTAPAILASFNEKEPSAQVNHWHWPANGPTLANFSSLNKGMNIGGQLGDPIFATASGKVVYSGHGLRGYGNLIIIKHNSTFLTAYAHNSKVFVKDGEWVNAGQRIAEMGNTGTQRVMLHFEIRRHGQPVNPSIYLAQKI